MLRRVVCVLVHDNWLEGSAAHAKELVKHKSLRCEKLIYLSKKWLFEVERNELDFAYDRHGVSQSVNPPLKYIQLRSLDVDLDEVNAIYRVVACESI